MDAARARQRHEPGRSVWSLGSYVDNFIYAATGSGIYVSANSGASWTLMSDGITGTVLRVTPDDKWPTIYYAYGTDGIFRTANAGLSWTKLVGKPGFDLPANHVRALKQFSGDKFTRLFVGTEQGVYVGETSNSPAPGAVKWKRVAPGVLDNKIIWALASFKNTPGTLLAGTQDNGGYGITFVAPIPNPADKPKVNGTLQVGKAVTAYDGDWSGPETIEFSYQWQHCTGPGAGTCSDIPGATDKTYTIPKAYEGQRLRVYVTANNDFPTFDFDKVASDVTTLTILPAPGTVAGSITAPAPDIDYSGQPQPGTVVTALNPAFLPAAVSFTFRWYRCNDAGINCLPIEDGVGKTYTIKDEDVGSKICATATGLAGGANPGSSTSGCGEQTNLVLAPNPVQLTPSTMLGDAYVGYTLGSGTGAWKYPGTTFTRQWESCEANGTSCYAATVKLGVGGSGIVALPKRKLAAGDYRAVVTPIDAAGNRGAARTIAFKVDQEVTRSRERDGWENQLKLAVLTNFGPAWEFLHSRPRLRRFTQPRADQLGGADDADPAEPAQHTGALHLLVVADRPGLLRTVTLPR